MYKHDEHVFYLHSYNLENMSSRSPYQTIRCAPFSFICYISNIGKDN